MKQNKMLRTLGAIVLGETALVLLTTLAQEVFFDGISLTNSPIHELIIGGALTMIAAVIAGLVTAKIAGKKNYFPSLVISSLIIAETAFLIISSKTVDPVWFDALAGLSLVAGIWIGYIVIEKQMVSHPTYPE